jgi:hypothetical protein
MLEIMPESNGPVLALKATGILTDADYKDIWIPNMDEIIKQFGKVKILLYMTEDCGGWQRHAAWDDAVFGLKNGGATLKEWLWSAQENGWNGVLGLPRT